MIPPPKSCEYRKRALADGAVVGTFFKKDGVSENEADSARVAELMAAVNSARS